MHQNNLLTFIVTLSVSIGSASATSWMPIKGTSLNGLAIDSQSIQSYPGMVIFNSRHSTSFDNSMFFFNKSAYLCGSGEVWGIASKIDENKDIDESKLNPEVSDIGMREYLSVSPIIGHIKKYCGSRFSKTNAEVPVTSSIDKVILILAKETTFNRNKIAIWEKTYPYIEKPFMPNGEPFVYKGETITNKIILRDGAYGVANWEYDCLDKTAKLLSNTNYPGKKLEPQNIDVSKLSNHQKVVPGSIGQQLLEFSCGLK